ncbi:MULTISPECIES: hypothetical protein [Geomicrobium]|uniref:Holin-like toxin n=1 Tax=Geomicrobium sediminis TaxID=1347788 RepID=A0ABS2P6N1_9BACL|nr:MULTISPECIES: hypothetical protein [Geomicrobium]MBM7631070.1 hypothetical protein [Geomicrobium sediminis]
MPYSEIAVATTAIQIITILGVITIVSFLFYILIKALKKVND